MVRAVLRLRSLRRVGRDVALREEDVEHLRAGRTRRGVNATRRATEMDVDARRCVGRIDRRARRRAGRRDERRLRAHLERDGVFHAVRDERRGRIVLGHRDGERRRAASESSISPPPRDSARDERTNTSSLPAPFLRFARRALPGASSRARPPGRDPVDARACSRSTCETGRARDRGREGETRRSRR